LMWVDSKNINAIKILMADSGWWVNKTQLWAFKAELRWFKIDDFSGVEMEFCFGGLDLRLKDR
jgi:hypothetical protein